jgi:hypothetical protein
MSAETTSPLDRRQPSLVVGWTARQKYRSAGCVARAAAEPSNRGRDGSLILIDYLVIMDYMVIIGEGG